MCISVDRFLCQRAKLRNPKIIVTRYKVLQKSCEDKVISPVRHFSWKIGLNKSNAHPSSKLNVRKKLPFRLYKGIHVFVYRKDAEVGKVWYNGVCKVVKVQCKNEDLIVVGHGSSNGSRQEVYTQATLSEKEYKKVIK